ncbi:hypothetical protein GCM10027456_31730 [Kineosporia babensis]
MQILKVVANQMPVIPGLVGSDLEHSDVLLVFGRLQVPGEVGYRLDWVVLTGQKHHMIIGRSPGESMPECINGGLQHAEPCPVHSHAIGVGQKGQFRDAVKPSLEGRYLGFSVDMHNDGKRGEVPCEPGD